MEEGWTIAEAMGHLHLSKARVYQRLQGGSLLGRKIAGKFGPEWRIEPTLLPLTEAERLARVVLALQERLRGLERDRVTMLVQGEAIGYLKRRATHVATCMDGCPIGRACLTPRLDAQTRTA